MMYREQLTLSKVVKLYGMAIHIFTETQGGASKPVAQLYGWCGLAHIYASQWEQAHSRISQAMPLVDKAFEVGGSTRPPVPPFSLLSSLTHSARACLLTCHSSPPLFLLLICNTTLLSCSLSHTILHPSPPHFPHMRHSCTPRLYPTCELLPSLPRSLQATLVLPLPHNTLFPCRRDYFPRLPPALSPC